MTHEEREQGALPTKKVTTRETVVLVRSLLVDWEVLEHLRGHRVNAAELQPELRAQCCKPDGGSCCVNKQP